MVIFVGLVVVCLGLLWISYWVYLVVVSMNQPITYSKEPTKQQIERDRLKIRIQLRNLRAEIMRWYINHPKYKDNFKLLIRKELEVAQMLKGLKRRTISDIKYEKIKKAAETGTFDRETLDMLN